MRIGVGLPSTISGTAPGAVLAWARRADAGPFSSLGTLDRVVYAGYDPLLTLAVCAGATTRIGLMTTVLLAPLRPAAILAKETASLDALSGGRLTLGLGIGGRADDFAAAGAELRGRGQRFEQQLALLRHIWAGEAVSAEVGPIGPAPARAGGPALLIGGSTPRALARVGRWADGYIAGSGSPESAARNYALAEEGWHAAGRAGRPRFVACFYFGLGPDGAEAVRAFIGDYYAFVGAAAVERMVASMPSTATDVRERLARYEAIGVDEVIAWPCTADLEQLDRLAELVGTRA